MAPMTPKMASRLGSPTAEVLSLRDEVIRLRHTNHELVEKLRHTSHVSRRQISVDVGGSEVAMRGLDGQQGGPPSLPKQSGGGAADDMLLRAEEVEEAAMRCCWLAHYWTLAKHFGVCSGLAADRAAYWQDLSPPTEVFYECARRMAEAATGSTGSSRDIDMRTNGASAGGSSEDSGVTGGSGRDSLQATAADLIEVERGLRQLQELGVMGEVVACIAHHGRLTHPAEFVDRDDPSLQYSASQPPLGLSPPEVQELHFQKAWLAYIWGRAARAGISTHLTQQRAEYWAQHLHEPPTLRTYQDIALSMQDIQLLSIESHLWAQRYKLRPA